MEIITVAVRVRPRNETEIKNKDEQIWEINSEDQKTVGLSAPGLCDLVKAGKIQHSGAIKYTYQRVFGADSSNLEIYNEFVEEVVQGFLGGTSGSVMMYGPTGSGKTFTMLGNEQKRATLRESDESPSNLRLMLSPIKDSGCREGHSGILFYAIEDIFRSLEESDDPAHIKMLKCSYVEVYNDLIYDLLQEKTKFSTPLSVSESEPNEFKIKGIVEEPIRVLSDVINLIRRGERNRHYAESVMHHHSSRSHTLFQIKLVELTQENTEVEAIPKPRSILSCQLNFVDLAGNEKALGEVPRKGGHFKNSWGYQEDCKSRTRSREGKYINRSLFYLTQVLARRSSSRSPSPNHVPYRNTGLTKLLKSTINGNGKTRILMCIAPVRSQFEQSLQTLKLGITSQKIEKKSPLYRPKSAVAQETLQILINEYESRLTHLEKKELSSSRNTSNNNILLVRIKELEAENAKLKKKLAQKSNNHSSKEVCDCLLEENSQLKEETNQLNKRIEVLQNSLSNAESYIKNLNKLFKEYTSLMNLQQSSSMQIEEPGTDDSQEKLPISKAYVTPQFGSAIAEESFECSFQEAPKIIPTEIPEIKSSLLSPIYAAMNSSEELEDTFVSSIPLIQPKANVPDKDKNSHKQKKHLYQMSEACKKVPLESTTPVKKRTSCTQQVLSALAGTRSELPPQPEQHRISPIKHPIKPARKQEQTQQLSNGEKAKREALEAVKEKLKQNQSELKDLLKSAEMAISMATNTDSNRSRKKK